MEYEDDVLDFLRRGVDFEGRDEYRKKVIADEKKDLFKKYDRKLPSLVAHDRKNLRAKRKAS
jgi:hypothetical protein